MTEAPGGGGGAALWRLARLAYGGLRRRVVVDVGLGVGGTVLIAGSARSGTTWVGDRVAAALGARVVFEPFIVDERGRPASLRPSPWNESATRRSVSWYLIEGGAGDPWEAAVARILAGRVGLLWRDRTAPGFYRRRVVKAVRGNLLLGHVAARWPRLPAVWLVRDPVAVVGSQLRMRKRGWGFDWQAECVLEQPRLMSDWLAPFEEVIRGAQDLVDRLAVRWCVENYVPSRQSSVARGVLRLSYEELCGAREGWRRLSGRLVEAGLIGERALKDGLLPGLGETTAEPGRGAEDALSAEQRRRVRRIVERFDLCALAEPAAR